MIVIRGEIEDQTINDKDERFALFNKITNKLLRRLGFKSGKKSIGVANNSNVMKLLFMAAVEMVDNRFKTALDEVGSDELLLTSFASKFSLSSIMEAEFGVRNAEEFLSAVRRCKKKILISLDGFDTHSEDFRFTTSLMKEDSYDYRSRKEFEHLFFRTLLEVATNFHREKTDDKFGDEIAKLMDFCIVLPKDRYDQLQISDRDFIKKKFGTLSWSAQELQELLTRRLEYLITTIDESFVVDEKCKDFELRMNRALAFFQELPTSVEMNVGGNIMRMSLFNYILRSSFWRPRDVISNLSKIMSQVVRKSGNDWKSKENLTEDNIKLSIKKNADKIIEREFIGEYKYVFRNIVDVLDRLQGLDEQLTPSEFYQILKGVRFETSFSYNTDLVDEKVRVLYQLGVIGLIYNKQVAKKQHYLNHICFEFNEGMAPLEDFLKLKNKKENAPQIVFNPLFTGRLMLTYNTRELIGNWESEYIRENHINKESIHGM